MAVEQMLRAALGSVRRATGRSKAFEGSSAYWERRYKLGGNSGAGSYNRLAEFKAETLNAFVDEHGVKSVVEFGSGDGAQLELARYPKYLGVDVAETSVSLCLSKFAGDVTKSFSVLADTSEGVLADLSLSLDVIYHLVEDQVFARYMERLFEAAERFVIVYASNEDKAWNSPHVRHRCFSDWIERERQDWSLVRTIPNRYPYDPADEANTSFADFYIYRRG